MKTFLATLLAGCFVTCAAWAQIQPSGGGGLTFTDGTHTIIGSTRLTVTGGTIGGMTPNATLTISASATSFTPGTTTILSATAPCFLVNSTGTTSACDALGANVATALGLTLNGSGALAATTSPTFVAPTLGAATATSLNGLTITPSTGTLTLAAAKTLTVSNTLTFAGTDASTLNIGTGGTLGALAFITPGTGIATALGVNVGIAGAPVLFNGAGGTPSSLTLTNATGLPVAGGGTGAATLTANGLVLAHGTSAFTALAEVDGNCVVGAAGVWTAGSCGGATGLTINSTTIAGGAANKFLYDDGTKLQEAALGTNLLLASSTLSLTSPVETAQTASFSVAATDMGKTTPVNCSGACTITLPSSGAFSTVFAAGQVWYGQNINTTADPITNSTGGTMFPTITSLESGDTLAIGSDGTSLYAGVLIGKWSGTGPVARTVSPTFTTPALGTPSALVLTNATGLPAAQVPATPATAGTNVTLTGPRAYYWCSGTCTVTLPVPVAGYEFCIRNADNVATVITLAALGSSARYEQTARTGYGTAGTGTAVAGGVVTDQICLLGKDSTHYDVMSSTGTWTMN